MDQFNLLITEDDISHALNNPFSSKEQLYTQNTLNIGTTIGAINIQCPAIEHHLSVSHATTDHNSVFPSWHQSLSDMLQENGESVSDEPTSMLADEPALVLPTSFISNSSAVSHPSIAFLPSPKPTPSNLVHTHLNDKQKIVYDIEVQGNQLT
ncbi:hypothetical protein EI94DRAFT_1807980 [Lactarius quietus]|nr:hypothetical protein EI94DRAFT_1807980 [Lactarius quietus]